MWLQKIISPLYFSKTIICSKISISLQDIDFSLFLQKLQKNANDKIWLYSNIV